MNDYSGTIRNYRLYSSGLSCSLTKLLSWTGIPDGLRKLRKTNSPESKKSCTLYFSTTEHPDIKQKISVISSKQEIKWTTVASLAAPDRTKLRMMSKKNSLTLPPASTFWQRTVAIFFTVLFLKINEKDLIFICGRFIWNGYRRWLDYSNLV